MAHAQKLQHLLRALAHLLFLLHHALPAKPGVEQQLAGLITRHHHEIVQRGHGGELVRDLERAQQLLVKQPVRRHARDVLTVEHHAARVRGQCARYQVEQRGFAGTIRADQSGYGTLGHFETGTTHRTDAAESLVQVFDCQHFRTLGGKSIRSAGRPDVGWRSAVL